MPFPTPRAKERSRKHCKEHTVARKEKRKGLFASLGSLGWPIFIGGWATGIYFLLVLRGPLHYDFLLRYTASHPINMTEVGLFFVGFASLICKFFSISGELGADAAIELPELAPGETTEEACNSILGRLSELPAKFQESYLGKRFATLRKPSRGAV